VALACKFLDFPGEHLLAYYADGKIRAWRDEEAEDCDAALARYAHPFYRANLRLLSTGSNNGVHAGI
jgi:hypothetical protein